MYQAAVVGFLVANIKSGAEQGNKDSQYPEGETKAGLASSGMGMVIWRMK